MRLAIPSCALFCMTLAACLGGEDGNPDGSAISGTIEVLSIDRQAHTITTNVVTTECQEDGTGIASADTSLDHYAIEDGRLILWNEEDCTATSFAGTSEDIVGTWTGTAQEAESAIPEQYRPATCPADPYIDTSGLGMLGDMVATYTISEKKIEIAVSGMDCMGEQLAASLEAEGLTLVSKNCNEVVMKDPLGNLVTERVSMSANRMSLTTQYKGKSCGYSMDFPMPGYVVDCAKQIAVSQAYAQCMRGAAGAKVADALRKASAKLF